MLYKALGVGCWWISCLHQWFTCSSTFMSQSLSDYRDREKRVSCAGEEQAHIPEHVTGGRHGDPVQRNKQTRERLCQCLPECTQ